MQCVVRNHTHLLYNRHLDQIVLSAIYGVCKVAQLRLISFKQIIHQYRSQPQAKSDIFRTVILRQTEPELQVSPLYAVTAFVAQSLPHWSDCGGCCTMLSECTHTGQLLL